jgi:hypothetical protein
MNEAVSQINTLAADTTRLTNELAAANETIATLNARIEQLSAESNAAQTAGAASAATELERSLTAANETLKANLARVQLDYTEMRKTALLIEKDRDRLQEDLDKELANPSAPPGTYNRLVSAVAFAASVCESTTGQPEWDANELKRLVFDMVQSMVPNASRAELDRKVHQVIMMLSVSSFAFPYDP